MFGLSVSAQYFTKPEQADQFFKTMLRSRIGRWILAEQHLKLSDQSYAKGSVGVLSPKINTRSVVEKVIFPFCFVGTTPVSALASIFSSTFLAKPSVLQNRTGDLSSHLWSVS